MTQINLLLVIFPVILGLAGTVNGAKGDEHYLGKHVEPGSERLFYAMYGVKKDSCQQVLNHRCFNNKTHFTVNYKADKKFCISAIKLTTYPVISEHSTTLTRRFYCQKGGIGTNECVLVVRKDSRHIAVNVEIFGIRSKKCSLKQGLIGSDPLHTDIYGLPYEFDKDDGWSIERTKIPKYARTPSEVFYHKDGIFNTQMSYLAQDDTFVEAIELVGKAVQNKMKFSVKIPNKGKKRISFLDIYWFQETMKEKPKYPFIYFNNGECKASDNTCELIFDTDERITYALVKVFSNTGYDGSRLREKDLGRG
uniref:Lofaxin n=1 Tax=Bichromomyia olmeca TaxID=715919 RepID=A0A1B1V3I4_9DIPT|nr:Lofaxin [Bichromomyia olmeca]